MVAHQRAREKVDLAVVLVLASGKVYWAGLVDEVVSDQEGVVECLMQ